MRLRSSRRRLLAGIAALVVIIALVLVVAGRGRDATPASRAALERIAAKNREAAIVSAARMKAESDAAAAAADARIAAAAEANAARPSR